MASSPSSMEPTNLHPPELRLSTSGLGIFQGKGSASSPLPSSGGSSRADHPISAETPFSPPMIQAQGPIGHRMLRPSSYGPTSAPGKTTSNPLWQQEASGSSSTSTKLPHVVPVDASPRPPDSPPTTTVKQHPPPRAEPEVANDQVRTSRGFYNKLTRENQVVSSKPSLPTNGGAGLPHDGTSATPHAQGGSPAVHVPQPDLESPPPLPVPTRPLSRNGPILSATGPDTKMPPTTDFQTCSPHPSPAGPGPSVNNPPNGPPAKDPVGTAVIQKPQPTSQPSPSNSPPSPKPSTRTPTPERPVNSSSPPPEQAKAQPQDSRSWWWRKVDEAKHWLNGT